MDVKFTSRFERDDGIVARGAMGGAFTTKFVLKLPIGIAGSLLAGGSRCVVDGCL